MIETENLQELISLTGELKAPEIEANNFELSSEKYPYKLALRNSGFEEEKERDRFVKCCVRMVRSSPEYRLWVEYIREVLGIHDCAITGETGTQVTIEMHHHPITLYEFTRAIVCLHSASSKEFCSFDVATKVIEYHYNNEVGYIPLATTLHEKYHNGFLSLPMNLVRGDWKKSFDKYEWEDEELSRIEARLAINRENCGWAKGYQWGKDSYVEEELDNAISKDRS